MVLGGRVGALGHRAMRRVTEHGAVVPGIRCYELRNALVANERRGRLDWTDTLATIANLRQMRISLDWDHDESVILALAREHRLSVYDAANLEVAIRHTLPVASLDQSLRQAATSRHIELLQ